MKIPRKRAVTALVLAVFLAGCAAMNPQPFEFCCCLGEKSKAEMMARHLEAQVEGLEAEVAEVIIEDGQNEPRIAYSVLLRHPDLNQDEICSALGTVECPKLDTGCE